MKRTTPLQFLFIACAVIIATTPNAVHARTEAILTPAINVPCPAVPCASNITLKDIGDKLINNTGRGLSQSERQAGDETVRRDAENQWDYNNAKYREWSRNRENRLDMAYRKDEKNYASATLGQEWAGVQTIGTVANTSGAVDNALVQLLGQYNDAARTAPDIHTGMHTGLNRAFAFACTAGCVSKDWAAALSTNSAIGGCTGGDSGNSFINPNELRRNLPKDKSISLAPGSKDVRCIAAFNQLVQVAIGLDDVVRSAKANSAQAAQVAVREAQAQNAVLAALRPLHADISVPNGAVSNAKQYDTKERAVKLYGVDCRRPGDLPSQKCSTAWQLAATRAQLDQQARQIDNSPASADALAAGLSASSAQIQQAAYNQNGGSIPLPAIDGLDRLIVAYFDRPDIIAYMASPEFGANVRLAMQDIPRTEKRVAVAMADYWKNSVGTFNEYSLAEIYPDVFGAYAAAHQASQSAPSLASFLAGHGIETSANPNMIRLVPTTASR